MSDHDCNVTLTLLKTCLTALNAALQSAGNDIDLDQEYRTYPFGGNVTSNDGAAVEIEFEGIKYGALGIESTLAALNLPFEKHCGPSGDGEAYNDTQWLQVVGGSIQVKNQHHPVLDSSETAVPLATIQEALKSKNPLAAVQDLVKAHELMDWEEQDALYHQMLYPAQA
ncbi:hypothetical protein [Ferrimonas marina]|uniref:Uncharacterized protein n=1 Tax=Ferrimonas marina TaxID=299255 RepID=A0A1M5TKU0_9GAMM|nr:hypothetical protein [Ferrimonas marina]SHH51425.1 hypothetical protein SAMN02745129_2187 [Ferrimonas marina]